MSEHSGSGRFISPKSRNLNCHANFFFLNTPRSNLYSTSVLKQNFTHHSRCSWLSFSSWRHNVSSYVSLLTKTGDPLVVYEALAEGQPPFC